MKRTNEWTGFWRAMAIFATVLVTVTFLGSNASADYTGTITIVSDGTFAPPEAPVLHDGKSYTLTDNVLGGILVQKSDITLNGAGKTLQKVEAGVNEGIKLDAVSDVTILGFRIRDYIDGVLLRNSEGNTISGNDVAGCHFAIILAASDNNTVSENTVWENDYGIHLNDATATR